MRSFAQRSREPEWMEAPDVAETELEATLADLAKVNTLTLARPPTLAWLARATRQLPRGASFSLLDVGYGHGDMLRAICAWARRRGLEPALTGIDLSPWSATAAEAATDPSWRIRYLVGDVFEHAPPAPIDFVVSSLVAHHMPDATLARFIGWMEANARRGWLVNDLHRHPVAYYGFMALSTATGMHPMVRHDGLVSVARAFTAQDWRRLLAEAKIAPGAAAVQWRFPFRICIGRLK
ncbi:MAG TPA: methyltransferase domain-containing protein [Caulobacteraceae bacterium]|nr:methyltransferase domain-containing protein [Caulobacteraceae bacterium]